MHHPTRPRSPPGGREGERDLVVVDRGDVVGVHAAVDLQQHLRAGSLHTEAGDGVTLVSPRADGAMRRLSVGCPPYFTAAPKALS